MAIGFGIIGCGMISRFHAKAVADIRGAKVTACFDSFTSAADKFGAEIHSLAAGVEKLYQLRVSTRPARAGGKPSDDEQEKQSEVLRKMVLAMVEDVRVVLVRLASRAQTLRYFAKNPTAERESYAQESLDIYAPLANRLGMWQLKWEIEDMSLRFIDAEGYKRIAQMLDEKRAERESFIATVIAELGRELDAAGIKAEMQGRPKHIFSIYNKMRTKALDFSEVHDVRAVRVIVESVKDCYAALGLVHNLWTPIPQEFDDYISRPKSNLYRSLHTAVVGPDGRALEVQIRTHDMHQHAEFGVASHWRYKESGTGGKSGARADGVFDEKIAWLRQLLAWRDEVADSAERVERFKHAALDDTVYVMTPQGKVVPPGGFHAGGFRLCAAHRSRPSLPRGQGRRAHGASRLLPRERPARGPSDNESPARWRE